MCGMLAMFGTFPGPVLAQEETTELEVTTGPELTMPQEATTEGGERQPQEDGASGAEGISAAQAQYSGDGCTTVARLSGNTSKASEPFSVGNTDVIITYLTNPNNDRGFNSTDIALVDDRNFTQIDSVEAVEGEDGQFTVPVEAGRYFIETSTFEQSYIISAQVRGGDEECASVNSSPEAPQPPSPPPPGESGGGPEKPPGDFKEGLVEGSYPQKRLANTSGASLAIPASLLLIGAGAAGLMVIRRS